MTDTGFNRLLFIGEALVHGLGFDGAPPQTFLRACGAGPYQIVLVANRLPDHTAPELQRIFLAALKLDKSRLCVDVLPRRLWTDFQSFQVICHF